MTVSQCQRALISPALLVRNCANASSQPVTVDGHAYYSVLVPTAPVPVGGGLLFVPEESVLPTDMSIDTFMGVYVSMGATSGKA